MKTNNIYNVHTDRCGNTCGQKCHAKGSRQEAKIKEFMYRDVTNVEHEMYDYTGNKWKHQNSNKRFKKNLEAIPRKHSVDLLQMTATMGTSHIKWKVLQSETCSLSGADYQCFRRSTKRKGL